MLRVQTGLLACLIVLFALSAGARAEGDFSKGLFWQIKSPQGQTSWLVGSIHVGDSRVEPKIIAAEKMLGVAQRLVLEMDRQELHKAGQMMQSSQDPPFAKDMSIELAGKARSALMTRGVAEAQIDKTPLWLAILMLASPTNNTPGMDVRLMQKAATLKRPVTGLETAREQLDTFRGLPTDVLSAILVWQVAHMDELNYDLSTVIDMYVAENLSRLVDLEFETSAPDTLTAEQQALVLDRLINQRNVRMVERMQVHLKAGRALVAVGAMHLPGLLHELDALGYTVQRVEM